VAHRGLGIPVHERDDLEQEVMADLWQGVNRAGFDFKAGFWGFVEVVASRRCIDWLRSRRGLVPVAESLRDRAKGPYERVLEGERSEIASRVLQSLDPACREIVIMRLHEGLSYGEMARKLGRSEGALRVQMYRCIQRAQHIVDEVAGASGRDVEKGTSDEPQ
jgi:RNA polymerase sigma-70 factor (ECF subfamily)